MAVRRDQQHGEGQQQPEPAPAEQRLRGELGDGDVHRHSLVGRALIGPPGRRRRSPATRRWGTGRTARCRRLRAHRGRPTAKLPRSSTSTSRPPSVRRRDGAHRRLRDEQGGERPVVAGGDGVLDGPVGHQPADRAEVAGGGVPPGDDDLDVAGQPLDLLEDVGAEEHRAALVAEAVQQVHQVHPLARVDPVERLVEQQDGRVVDERGGDLDALAHALGVGVEAASAPARPCRRPRGCARWRRPRRAGGAGRRWRGRTGGR